MLVAAPGAALTINHGNFAGTNIDFDNVRETTSSADLEYLRGRRHLPRRRLHRRGCAAGTDGHRQLAPLLPPGLPRAGVRVGIGLHRLPASDRSGRAAARWDTITEVIITEYGDAILCCPSAVRTGTFASMAGFVTVTETLSGPIAPVVIPFSGTFTPSNTLLLPGDGGTTLLHWFLFSRRRLGRCQRDEGNPVFDNDLYAYSDAAGSSAKIQKKVIDGPAAIVITVPEPVCSPCWVGGLLGLMLLKRSVRR